MKYYKYVLLNDVIFFALEKKSVEIFGMYRCSTLDFQKENCEALLNFIFIESFLINAARTFMEFNNAIEISKEEFNVHCNFAIEILQSNVSNKEMKLAKVSGNDIVDAFNYKQVISKQNEI